MEYERYSPPPFMSFLSDSLTMVEIDDLIQKKITATHCYICDAYLLTPQIAEIHYKSEGHWAKVQLYSEEILEKMPARMVKKIEPVKTNEKNNFSCLICNVFKLNQNELGVHNKSDEHKKKKEAYCETCDIVTMSKEQLWEHMKGSKHNKKLENLGLPAINVQYSPFDQTLPQSLRELMRFDRCQVCNKILQCMKDALVHYKSKGHGSSVCRWYKEKLITEKTSPNTNIKENGNIHTAASLENIKTNPIKDKINHNLQKDNKDVKEQVFQEIDKLEKQSFSDKNIPELPKTNSKENNDMHNASSLENIKTNSNKTKINHNLQKGGKDVKEQVFQEIDKLVKTLYYSKTVPYDVALEYLKNINKEVENLKKMYKKKYMETTIEFKGNLRRDVEGEYFRNSDFPALPPNFNASNKKIIAKDVEVDTKEYTIEYIQVEEPNKGAKMKTAEIDKIDLQNSIQLEEQDNLDTLLNKIVLIKNQVTDDVERDVLTEIEKLIKLVNSDDIPPDVTLMCLQEFNSKLN